MGQTGGAIIGCLSSLAFGESYVAAGVAMVVTVVYMLAVDAIHPPSVPTALSFAFRTPGTSLFVLFMISLALIAVLVGLTQVMLWIVRRLDSQHLPADPPES